MEYDWPGNVRELENVIEQAVVLGKGGRIGLEDLRQAYLVSSLHRLRVDHAQLFVGPFQLAAPPFGSVYLEQRQTLMGESTQMVKELYRQDWKWILSTTALQTIGAKPVLRLSAKAAVSAA